MPGVSFLGAQSVEPSAIAAGPLPITVTSGSANVKGSWAQAIAATAAPTAWLQVSIAEESGGNDYLLDVGIGGAGSETVLIANIPAGTNANSVPAPTTILFPLAIPAGTRIALRCQNTAGGPNLKVQVHCFAPLAGGETGLGRTETGGAITATTQGTTVDPGGTADTDGAWVEMVAATSFPYRWFTLCALHTNSLSGTTRWAVDVGIGAAGSEVVAVPDLCVIAGAGAGSNSAPAQSFPLCVPDGSRVAVRARCSINTSPNRNLEVVVIGVG